MTSRKKQRFDEALVAEHVDKTVLGELTWSGIPDNFLRCEVWQLLLGYRPLTCVRRAEVLRRKREEYYELRRTLYDASPVVTESRDGPVSREDEMALLLQIRKDLPRTFLRAGAMSPAELLVESPRVQLVMERVLFVWAVRQPASGYVQGLNDVLLPLILVFVSNQISCQIENIDVKVLSSLSDLQLDEVEADCYWCAAKILSEIFDHYTHGQPGIQRMVSRLKGILQRIDEPLTCHLEEQGVDILHSAFRWITCLMVRELPMVRCIRLWDTLIAESALAAGNHRSALNNDCGSAGFEALLVYFCASFTTYFSSHLQCMDFEQITFFLQKMPTDDFAEGDIEVLLGEAYVLKSLFQQAPKHLDPKVTGGGV